MRGREGGAAGFNLALFRVPLGIGEDPIVPGVWGVAFCKGQH